MLFSIPMKIPRPDRLLVFWLLLGVLAPLRAGNLVAVRDGVLVAPPAAASSTGLAATDTPLVVRAGAVWRYAASEGRWNDVSPRLEGSVVRGVLASGSRSWLLLGPVSGLTFERMVPFAVGSGPHEDQPPPFPVPLRVAHGAVQGGVLYLAGVDAGGGAHWWSLNLGAPRPQWAILPTWTARSRGVGTVVAQDATLLLTASATNGEGDELWRWTAAEGWLLKRTLPGAVVPGAARPLGQAHVLYLLRLPPDAAGTPRIQLWTYHTTTASVAAQGAERAGDARLGAGWRNGLVWLDAAGAVRTAEIQGNRQLLRPLDWAMIILYFAMIAGIGAYCYRNENKKSTAEFFVGSRAIPFWAAGISLYASNSSSIGYIATTAKAYATDWTYLMGNITNVFALFFVAIWIVPLLRRLSLTSVFDYLDQRFHHSVRLAGSGMCILMHLGGRMSIILFLPALAISTVTGLAVEWSILMMGVVTIAYTALGGMKAVIWTDVAQVVVKFGGLFFAIAYIVWALKGGAREFVATAVADDKFRLIDWSFDLTKATVWGFIFLQLMETILTFPKDQVLMQRVFATKSEKEASRSIWLFAAIVLPGSLILYLIGTGLYVFYHSFPERMNPLLRTDATLPLFIAAELPAGVTGLVLAGLFAAAMGTLSSILNSVATLVSVDFYESLAKKPSQATSIRLAEWVTVIAGVIGIGLALLLSRFSISSFLDIAIEFAGLFGGAFGGAYTLGMFTRRSNWQGVLIGMGFSFIATFVVWWHHLVHPFLYLGISILFSIVVGYAASLFFPAPTEVSLRGLTVFTPKGQTEAKPA
ncbi:MAG: sodium:solute symporter [Opitutae bacterium]|nr:sodium:solute symporter [Opitutae bacterium]